MRINKDLSEQDVLSIQNILRKCGADEEKVKEGMSELETLFDISFSAPVHKPGIRRAECGECSHYECGVCMHYGGETGETDNADDCFCDYSGRSFAIYYGEDNYFYGPVVYEDEDGWLDDEPDHISGAEIEDFLKEECLEMLEDFQKSEGLCYCKNKWQIQKS